jgi:hypothetical protein
VCTRVSLLRTTLSTASRVTPARKGVKFAVDAKPNTGNDSDADGAVLDGLFRNAHVYELTFRFVCLAVLLSLVGVGVVMRLLQAEIQWAKCRCRQ